MLPHVSLEFVLTLGYAVALAFIAMLLELAARHAHRRALRISTIGFTYHPDRDIWRCPEDQHLFPVSSDSMKGTMVYRAPAEACNACRSKTACTDSNNGREIERRSGGALRYGMERFHRAVSLLLLILASLILAVEIFRASGFYPRAVLAAVLMLFCAIILRLSTEVLSSLHAYVDSSWL